MNNQTYNINGTYVAIAGVLVSILAKWGVNTDVSTIMAIVGLVVTIFGVIQQKIAHKKLAITTGTITR